MKLIILLALTTAAICANAQEKVFTEDDLVAVIVKFHPVVKQAAINVKIAKVDILSARGSFDPQLTTESARKEFGGFRCWRRTFFG